MVPFNVTLRQWRLERGLTQEQLAQRARVPRPNLSAIERGKRDISLFTLRALAVGLGVRPGVLADGIPPGVDEEAPSVWSRRVLDRIAEAVVTGTVPSSRQEQTIVGLLRQVVTPRILAAPHHGRSPGLQKSRANKAVWVRLRTLCPPQVLRGLMERVDKHRQRLP